MVLDVSRFEVETHSAGTRVSGKELSEEEDIEWEQEWDSDVGASEDGSLEAMGREHGVFPWELQENSASSAASDEPFSRTTF